MLIIPIGHDKAIYRLPVFTIGVIAVCTLVQVVRTIMHFADMTGYVGELHPNDPLTIMAYYPTDVVSFGLITHQFAHGGYFHLVGNMLFLWMTGANMEYRWGTKAWAAVYLIGGIVAAFTFGLMHPGADVPLVGASGAIAAAMGAFMVCLFRAKIRFWYFYFFFFRLRHGTFIAPAYVALPLWFLGEAFSMYFFESHAAGVAYSAHVSGFVFGAAIAFALRATGYEDKLRAAVGSDVFDEDDQFLKDAVNVPSPPAPGRYAGAQRFAAPGPPLPIVGATAPPVGMPSLPAPLQTSSFPPPKVLNPLLGSSPPLGPAAAIDPDAEPISVDFAPDAGSLPAPSALDTMSAKPGGKAARFEAAIELGDAAAVRLEGSSYLEEAARTRPGEVVPMFRRVISRFKDGTEIPLDDRSLAIAVRFAADAEIADLTLAAARALIVQYPRSRHTPGAMWEAAHVQTRQGWDEKARNTLQNLVKVYPESEAATRARRMLEALQSKR